jgi:PAS domain S-box-containing protein
MKAFAEKLSPLWRRVSRVPTTARRPVAFKAQPAVPASLMAQQVLGSSQPENVQAPEQALPDAWRRQQLYDLAPVGFLSLDQRARILELNQKAASLLGSPHDRLRNRSFLVFIARRDILPFVRTLVDSTRNREQHTLELDLVIDRRIVPAQISVLTVGHEPPVHEVAIVDLTDVRMMENWLQESLAHWHSLVHNAPDTIMTLDESGTVMFVNKPLWNHSADALVGTHIFSQFSKREALKLRRCLKHAFKFGRRIQCEVRRDDNGQQQWFTFSFGPGKAADGGGVTTVLIRDTSKQKRTEKMLRASSEQLRDFAARLDAVREDERTRVARELHDELGQALTILKLDLAWIHRKLRSKGELRERTKVMIAHVDETIERVRRISSELRPSILDDLGLAAAIEWQLSEFQKRTDIRAQIVSDAENVRLARDAEAATFRVVQEALTNVIRHAEATRVGVVVRSEHGLLRISIEDNGKGITEEQINSAKSLGIVGMRERIARLGGKFNILSGPGKGTRLEIEIPQQ